MGKKRRDGRASRRGNNSASNADARNSGGGGLLQASTGLLTGTARIRYGNGIYEGEVRDGKPHGRGELKLKNGEFFEGDWKEGAMHGWGVQHASGAVYEGEFKDGAIHGKGTMKYATGNVYEGQWIKGTKLGRGTFKWADGRLYEGEFADGEVQGWGTMAWPSGHMYEGDFKEGKKHGNGTIKYSSGEVYEGEFNDGKKHGKGTVTLPTGEICEGIWVKGELVNAESTNLCPPPDNGTALKAKSELLDGRKMRSTRSQEGRLQADTKACEHCGVDDYRYKLRVCSGCNLALYCSAACQKAASRSHRRICDIISELPPPDADRLTLEYDRDKMVDLDAGLRYGSKYMDSVRHFAINLGKIVGNDDSFKLSAKKLSAFLKSKRDTLDSVSWMTCFTQTGYDIVWKELHGLKQLCLCLMQFDDAQCLNEIIDQQQDTLEVLCLPGLRIDWSRAKCRRSFALAVGACNHLVKLDLQGCVLMDSDLKSILHDLPNLRCLSLRREPGKSHEFTDNTCGLIARKCSGLQELNLIHHDQLSVRGIRKIFEHCPHLRSFGTSTCKLSCEDVQGLLDIAPQLLYLYLGDTISNDEASQIIEGTGGRTVFVQLSIKDVFVPDNLSTKARERYDCQRGVIYSLTDKRRDPEVANEWADMLEG